MGSPNVLLLFPNVLLLDLVDTTFSVVDPPVLAVVLLPPPPMPVVVCLNTLGALFFCDDEEDDEEDDDDDALFTDEGRIPGLDSSQSSSHCSLSPPADPPNSISAVGSFL